MNTSTSVDGCVLRFAVYLRVRRWTDAALLATVHVLHGLLLRSLTTRTVLNKWASAWQQTWWIALLGLLLGVLEDLCVFVGTYTLYWLLDKRCSNSSVVVASTRSTQTATVIANGDTAHSTQRPQHSHLRAWLADTAPNAMRFVGFAAVFTLTNALVCIDAVLMRTRQLRFSLDFVQMLVRERDAANELQIDARELGVLYEHVALTLGFATVVGLLGAVWVNPTEWDVLRSLQRLRARRFHWTIQRPGATHRYSRLPPTNDALEAGDVDTDASSERVSSPNRIQRVCRHISPRSLLLLCVASFVTATIALTQLVPSVVAMVAWNATLNEPLRLLLDVQLVAIRHAPVPTHWRLHNVVEHTTEDATFVSDDALVRHTRGFHGPLAFNVSVAAGEQLNVLVVVIESFRQFDSQYLVTPARYAARYGDAMPSLTPQFDKYAQRNVAISNMWSSWRTSRALETILFGLVPYDSVTETGTTGGRVDVALAGLPQLFHARGYANVFTTGTRTDYDDWATFLPVHGFDHVLDMWDVIDVAQDELGVDVSDGEQMMAYWGVHDHVSFDVLSYLLQKHHVEQQNRTFHYHSPTSSSNASETNTAPTRKSDAFETHKPWFVTHFTISSHVPFDERPDWYHRYSHALPDLSPFYAMEKDVEQRELMKNYAEMRYYSDLTLGLFLDNLNTTGVLDNTIVVITGDHGQAPERGSATPEQDQIAATRVAGAIIAKGRLGESAGLILEDVASHADLLNTIADIVGVDDDKGFLQSGVGHSLKRARPFGERIIHSNNPAVNMAAIQGHTRMQYDAHVSDAVQAYNTELDPSQSHDLMRGLPPARVQEILDICAEGRMLNEYFKYRWDHACILKPTC